jgi:hypothetical protein
LLKPDLNLPKGTFYDDLGFKVNRAGFLVDTTGNIIDDRGNIVFLKNLLDEGKLPAVFDITRPKDAIH